jgi:tetrahydromethanopterin S-methyltransferase subunit A
MVQAGAINSAPRITDSAIRRFRSIDEHLSKIDTNHSQAIDKRTLQAGRAPKFLWHSPFPRLSED